MSEVIVLPEGLHSPRGPSSSDRWLHCAEGTGGPQTTYAAEGTVMHWLSEQVREDHPLTEFKGRIIRSGEFEFKVGKSMMNAVTTFVESVIHLPGAPIVEEMVHYEELVPGGFGTLDDGRLYLDAGIITDFKGGKGVQVSAKGNTQMMLYDLGIFFKYDWLYKFKKFVNRISQPRRGVAAEVELEEISVGHLLQWGYDVVRPRALDLDSGKLVGQIQAGPWCKFCGKKDTCETRARYKISHETGSFARDASDELVNMEEGE